MASRFWALDRGVDRIGYWYGFYVIATAGLAWLAKQVPALAALSWAEAVLIGLSGGMLLMLGTAASLALWRYFRPIVPSQPSTNTQSDGQLEDLSKEVERLRIRLAKTQDDLSDAFGIVDSLKESLGSYQREASELHDGVKQSHDQAVKRIASLEGAVVSIEKAGRDAIFAAEILPLAKSIAEGVAHEAARKPSPIPPPDHPYAHRHDDTRHFSDVARRITLLRARLLDNFTEAEIGPIFGYCNIEGISRAQISAPEISEAERPFWTTKEQRYRWLQHIDHVQGTSMRLNTVISFLEAKTDLAGTLDKLYSKPTA